MSDQTVTLTAAQVKTLRAILASSDPGWHLMQDEDLTGQEPPLPLAEWKFLAKNFWPWMDQN